MPLNNYNMKSGAASFGEGLLGGVMVGRKLNEDDIRNARLDRAEARTKVIQGREDAAYSEANAVTPFKANPEHGPEVHNYLMSYGQNLGLIDENGGIKNANKVKLREVLAKDENAQHDILQLQRRKLTGEISALEASVGDDPSGLSAVTAKQLQEKKARLENLNYTDKAWVAEQTAKRQKQKDADEQTNKEKENVIRERTATAAEKTADRATTLPAMRDKYARMPDGLEKVALGNQIKAEEEHELKKTKAAHENELEKARILAGGKTAAQEAKAKKDALTQTTATVNKYYSDLEKTVRAKLADIELDPDSKREWAKIGQNISVYRNNDLKAVQNGQEPPNIAKLTGETGQVAAQAQPAAQPAKAPQTKQPPPKEGDTFKGGKGSYIYKNGKWNLQTGAAVPERSMVPEANAATGPAGRTIIQDDRPAGISPKDWKYLQTLTPLARQAALDQRRALKKSAYMAQMQN